MRLRHIQGAEETIVSSPPVIQEPKQHRGTQDQVLGNNRPLEIEVGVGKGRFIMEKASANPDINYIGIERYSSALLRRLQKRSEMDLENIYFMCIDAKDMTKIFAPGEVDRIYLNFSDPQPKDCHAKRRLTSPVFMSVYDGILAPRGVVEFKIGNRGLFEYSMESILSADWEITEHASDLHNSIMAEGNVMTEYGMEFASEGKSICKLIARRTGTCGQDPAQDTGKGYHQRANNIALPPGITKKLLQTISDKTDLNKQALRFNHSLKEVGKLPGSGSAKAKKDRNKK